MGKVIAVTEGVKTHHTLVQGDARAMSYLADESIHLVVTSPPYWTLKRYNENRDQMGHIDDYESFLGELERVWKEVFRVLVPGGAWFVLSVMFACLGRGTRAVTLLYHCMQTYA